MSEKAENPTSGHGKPAQTQHTGGTTINLYVTGGNNLIAPIATTIIQNFYNDRPGEVVAMGKKDESDEASDTDETGEAVCGAELSSDEKRLNQYISNDALVRKYVDHIVECSSARQLADVVGRMMKDAAISSSVVVKAVFINTLLPFAVNIRSGRSVDNIRQHINQMLCGRR